MQACIDSTNRRIADLEQRMKRNETARKSGQQFTPSEAQLKQDFEQLYKSIQQMSTICMERVSKMTEEFQALETDIIGPASVVKAIKDARGAKYLDEYATEFSSKANASAPEPTVVVEPSRKDPVINAPGEGFEINLKVEDNVGRLITERTTTRPLVITVAPNAKRATPWSRQEDFYVKLKSTDQSKTSLKELYYPR